MSGSLTMHLDISKRVPIAQIEGSDVKWLVETGCPVSEPPKIMGAARKFLNERKLQLRGLDRLKRYTMIDYGRQLLVTSEDPIPFEGQECPIGGDAADSWKIRLVVNGDEHEYYVETGAAYSYVHGLFDKVDFPEARIRDFGVSGKVWDADVYKVRASFCGNEFDLLCADASDSEEGAYAVPEDGVNGRSQNMISGGKIMSSDVENLKNFIRNGGWHGYCSVGNDKIKENETWTKSRNYSPRRR